MNNTINVNYMTRTYNQFLKGQQARKTSGTANSFAEKLTGKGDMAEVSGAESSGGISGTESTGEVSGAERTGVVSTKDMTMDEYKEYIRDKISEIPLHPSRMKDSIAIHISESGFEAMKNDPEYEAWVLDGIKEDFAFNNPWAAVSGGHYCVKNFGATKEEYHGESWYAEHQNGNGKSLWESKAQGSFWERRVDNKNSAETQTKRQQARKRVQQEQFAREMRNRQIAHKRQLTEFLQGDLSSGSVPVGAMTQALASYEANMLTDLF